MDAVKIRCRNLMVGDWVANRNGSPMKIVAVDEDNAYACEGNEEHPWIFGDDEGYEPQPIKITTDILIKNNWKEQECTAYPSLHFYEKNVSKKHLIWNYGILSLRINSGKIDYRMYPNIEISSKYVHELQHALRLIGLNEMANNFKV